MKNVYWSWPISVIGSLNLGPCGCGAGGPYFTWRFVRTSSFVGQQILGQARTIGNPSSIDCFLSSLPRCLFWAWKSSTINLVSLLIFLFLFYHFDLFPQISTMHTAYLVVINMYSSSTSSLDCFKSFSTKLQIINV